MYFQSFNKLQLLLIGLSFGVTSCGMVARSPSPSLEILSTAQAESPVASGSPASNAKPPEIASSSPQQIAVRKRVGDYFLEIPVQYFEPLRTSSEQRQQLLEQAKQGRRGSIYDPDNGYLQLLPGGDLCSTYTVAIFSRPSASPLVALNVSCTVGDQVSILDPDRNWQNVTATVLPADLTIGSDANIFLDVQLPRFGRTIEISRQNLTRRYRFNGQQFVQE